MMIKKIERKKNGVTPGRARGQEMVRQMDGINQSRISSINVASLPAV
jgi:hypothetical protein